MRESERVTENERVRERRETVNFRIHSNKQGKLCGKNHFFHKGLGGTKIRNTVKEPHTESSRTCF